MNRTIEYSYEGSRADLGELMINRMFPNSRTLAVGPFVFLDYLLKNPFKARTPKIPDGQAAHPHRGIATFTYLLQGEMEHFDSRGHNGIVGDGGAQWMKAGNGIVHDENFSQAFQKSGGTVHGFQFWINLPSKAKAELPDYLPVSDNEFPRINLPGDAGVLKLVIGQYQGEESKVKRFSEHFIYHIQLLPGKSFTLDTIDGLEYGAILPTNSCTINGTEMQQGELVIFGNEGQGISIENKTETLTDVIVFGGEPYTEPIVAKGPFVMTSNHEISEAWKDFYAGKYGKIDYSSIKLVEN
jgi:redox-sensitive bicupin YhaK (pirin superfamily)